MKVLLIESSKAATDKKLKQFELEGGYLVAPNLGLLSIASEILKLGNYVEYFNVNRKNLFNDLSKKVKKFDIVCISTTSYSIEQDANLAFLARTQNPNALIVLGGYFAWDKPLEILKFTEADIVIRGHGEPPIRKLLKLGMRKDTINKNIQKLKKIDGLCFKFKKDGIENYHISAPFIHNEKTIKKVLAPSFDLFPWEKYDFNNFVYFYTSKGCPYSCKFCSVPVLEGKRIIKLKKEIVKQQILELIKIGGRRLFVGDPDFNVEKKHLIEICNLIIGLKKQNKIPKATAFVCQARIDLIDSEQLKKMRDAGFIKIFFGIESISKDILIKDVRKNLSINPNEILERLELVKSYEIVPEGYFILGLPETKISHLNENLNFIKTCKEKGFPCEIESFVVPFFETPYYKEYPKNVIYRSINFIRFKDGLISTKNFKVPWYLKPKNKDVYKKILNLRRKAINIRKKEGINYEQTLFQVICESV